MNNNAEVYFVLSLLFLVISMVFILFIVFHNKKMMEHQKKLRDIEIAKSKQDLRDAIAIEEKERARLGADIHDDLGPTLSAVKLKINSMKPNQPLAETELSQVKEMINQTIVNIRSLSHSLYPNTLKEFGLKEALLEMFRRISSMTHITIDADISDDTDILNFEEQLSLYRIVQEFCTNSIKHANCSHIFLSLLCSNSHIKLNANDNGNGPSFNGFSKEGLGIKSMRMRAESINATFKLESDVKKGTALTIELDKSYGKN
ncbi:MAG: hypothetical protein KA010_02935 [Saprospiraceae bacterium]|nr:hypothetical protein [Saprospiraceae bacterium]